MMKAIISVFFLLVVVLSSCVSWAKTENLGQVAEMSVDDALVFSKSNEKMPDFSVHYIKKDTKNILGIYMGNAPDINVSELNERISVGNCRSVPATHVQKENYNFDALIQIKNDGFPKFIHLFSRNIPMSDVPNLQRLLQGFRLVAPYQC